MAGLTKEECEQRVGLALGPLTYADLAALTADLPAGQPASLFSHPPGLLIQPPPGRLIPPPPGYLPMPASRPLNRLAVASLVCSVLPGLPLLAVFMGLIAHGQIQERGERGAGLATAAIMIGGVFSLLFIVLVLRP